MSFYCCICKEDKEENEVITLKCSHIFCWKCIEDYLKKNLSFKYECPVVSCNQAITDGQMRKVLPSEYVTKYEEYCLKKCPNSYSCLLPECGKIIIYDDKNTQFDCEKCTLYNCISCRESHKFMSCKDSMSKYGESRDSVCKKEILRARDVLKEKEAEWYRGQIERNASIILAPNSSIFECLCNKVIGKLAGITLKNCFHNICRECLKEHVKNSPKLPVVCPFYPCQMTLDDGECREVLSKPDQEIYEYKSLSQAATRFNKAERCRQINCSNLIEINKNIKNWKCSLCLSVNCIGCNAIHNNQNCKEYLDSKKLSDDENSIENLIKEKKLMRCPSCRLLIQKISGCNWIKCNKCNIELCWINQTYRWGPKGPGDITGGCKCGVNNKMCHPDCEGCIGDTQCIIM